MVVGVMAGVDIDVIVMMVKMWLWRKCGAALAAAAAAAMRECGAWREPHLPEPPPGFNSFCRSTSRLCIVVISFA